VHKHAPGWVAVAVPAILTALLLLANLLPGRPGQAYLVPGRALTSGMPSLVVAPYLGETTSSSVVLSWATAGSGPGEVRYSRDHSYSLVVPALISVRDGKTWYSTTIPGLLPDTAYHYRVYVDGLDLTPWSQISFHTAPATSSSAFTFAVLGDSRPWHLSSPPSEGALAVAAGMDRHSFDLVLHTGDIVYNGGVCSGADSSWQQYVRACFDLYRGLLGDTPLYPAVGNHELAGGDCGYQAYTDVYHLPANAPAGNEEVYYSFNWRNVHFVALDTSQPYTTGSPQLDWLVQDLQSNTQTWTVVFFHHPAYSSGNHGSTPEVQTYLVPVFETYGVDLVLTGHDHHYERTCPVRAGSCTAIEDGVVYYVTGGGGAPLRDVSGDWFTAHSESVYHFLEVVVDGCRLEVHGLDTTGHRFDAYEIDRCPDTPGSIFLYLPLIAHSR
jgi:hypothetical protein